MDGDDVPVELLSEDTAATSTRASGTRTTPSGEHTYASSRTRSTASCGGTDGHETQFYWNLVPGGWKQSIDKTDLSVHLPRRGRGRAVRRPGPGRPAAKTRGQGTCTSTSAPARSDPEHPVTVKAGLDIPTRLPARRCRGRRATTGLQPHSSLRSWSLALAVPAGPGGCCRYAAFPVEREPAVPC